MPTLPSNVVDGAGDKPYRVLLTGFGPFGSFAVNPSWLAVKPLHNLILDTQPAPVTHEEQVVLGTDGGNCGIRQLHITSLQVPTEYDVVLSTVPSFHTRPPTLPESDDPGHPMIPADGYDLVFHVGVAGPGPARLEKLGHKSGYQMRDAAGKMAPIIAEEGGEFIYKRMTEAEEIEMARIRERLPNIEKYQQTGKVPLRGFAKGYEQFEEEIHTDIDVERLVAHLKEAYPEYIRDSVDAGRYLCDFTYYCSLAEAQRQKEKDSSGKRTKVLFLHCPPIDQPVRNRRPGRPSTPGSQVMSQVQEMDTLLTAISRPSPGEIEYIGLQSHGNQREYGILEEFHKQFHKDVQVSCAGGEWRACEWSTATTA